GADRFGFYGLGEGKLGQGSLHIGLSGKGRPAAVWGATDPRTGKNLTSGERSRAFTNSAERSFLQAFNAGQPYNGVQVANAVSGAPDAEDVPLPRVSPTQR